MDATRAIQDSIHVFSLVRKYVSRILGTYHFVPAFLVCMNFHDTHFNIGDLPCKSQSCAKLGKFCANFVQREYRLC